MKKKRCELTVKEQIAICNNQTECRDCTISFFCWDEFDEPASINTMKVKTNWLNEEIEVPDETMSKN